MIIRLTPAVTIPPLLNLIDPSTLLVDGGLMITDISRPASVPPALTTVATTIGAYLKSVEKS